MSQIDNLIRELCPNGVDHKSLGEVGEFIRGSGLQKADLREQGVPAVHYGQIHTHYSVWATETKSFTDVSLAAKLRRAKTGDLLIATTSEDDEAVAKATAWLGEADVVLSGDACIYRHALEPKYMAYFFHSTMFHDQKRRFISGTKVRRVSGASLAKIRIPVPPLEVQRETVRILDQFTQLEAELEAELEARRAQYEYYRKEFLTFGKDVPLRRLDEIATYVNGKAHEKLVVEGAAIPLVTARFISRNGEANRYVPFEDVRTPGRVGDIALVLSDLPNGRALARTFFVDRDDSYAINQRVARIRVNDPSVVTPKFLHYVLDRNRGLLRHDNGVDQTHLSKAQVTGLMVPMPPHKVQERLVELIDRFDDLVNDISIGLPAELNARRKQYEHYRDRLLTFKELV